jgi:holo-[acyl-carrier protein] synthase
VSDLAGIGLDAVEIARMRQSLERTPSLAQRLFTAGEQRDCRDADGSWRYGRLAARFAAKEAVAKAFGTGVDGFGFTDIEIVNNDDGRPEVRLSPSAAAVAAGRGVGRLHLSLTHTRQLALAQVVAERAGVPGAPGQRAGVPGAPGF